MSEIARLALLDTDLLYIIFDNFKRQDDMFISLLVHPVWTQILIRKLWKEPVWKSPRSYQKFLKTLRSSSPFFPYAKMVRHLNFIPLRYRPHPSFSRKDIRFIADKCRCLTKLSVAWMMDPFDSYTFAKFLANSPNLSSISCPNCTMEWLTEALSPVMGGYCKNLCHLEVKNWAHESTETCALLEKVAENCDGITSLHAHLLVTKEIALMLVKSFPNLKYFKCHSVTNSGLAILIGGFRKLKNLDLTFDKEIQDNKDDETSLVEIGSNFPLLDSFQLSIGNENFPQFALAWAQSQYNLRHLELSLCDGLTDDSFILIVKHCDNLESIQLKWCSRLTDLSYSALAQLRNTRLRYLRVFRSGLTDIGLTEIAKNCSRLLKLDMEYCPEVTQESLSMVVKNCRKLVKLAGGFPQHTLASLGRSMSSHGSMNLQVLKFRDPLYRDSVSITSNDNFNNFDGRLLEQLARSYPQLRKLVVRCMIYELPPCKFVQIIHAFRNLEELFITPLEPLDTDHIMKLELHPKLKEVVLLGGCSSDAERYIEHHRNNLKMFIKVIKHDYKMYTIK